MISDRIEAATCAGIDSQRTLIRQRFSRIVERTTAFVDDAPMVRINEIRNGLGQLLFIGTAANALLFLSAYMEVMEEEA